VIQEDQEGSVMMERRVYRGYLDHVGVAEVKARR
jgi:hypothetical protein